MSNEPPDEPPREATPSDETPSEAKAASEPAEASTASEPAVAAASEPAELPAATVVKLPDLPEPEPDEGVGESVDAGSMGAAAGAIGHEPLKHPDDGPLSAMLRKLDAALGTAEQIALFGMLIAVVLTASIQALSSKIWGKSLLWSFYVIRAGTFATAMIGAAFASHQQRHLAMDLVSRRLPPRGRLYLRVFLGLFTIFVAFLLARAGLAVYDQVSDEGKGELIPPGIVALMIPLGAGLVVIHTILFLIIDIDYLVRGKLPPERARSGH